MQINCGIFGGVWYCLRIRNEVIWKNHANLNDSVPK